MGFFWRRGPAPAISMVADAAGAGAGVEGESDAALPVVALHYRTWGAFTTSDRAILLVHGLTASHKEWMALGPALAEAGWYVVAPDLRGRGLSAKPPHGYGIAFHADDLLALCDALKLDSVHVVGHSLGAVIGMYLAGVYPQRVRRLVMVDAGGVIPEDTAQAIAASVSRLGTVYPSLDAYLGLMRQLPMIQWNDLWDAYFRYDAEARPDGTVTSRVPKAAIEEESLALGLTRSEALPNLVKARTLIMRAPVGLLGPDRGLILPREEAERLNGIIPNSRILEVAGTNHYTIIGDGAFIAGVAQFLAEPE